MKSTLTRCFPIVILLLLMSGCSSKMYHDNSSGSPLRIAVVFEEGGAGYNYDPYGRQSVGAINVSLVRRNIEAINVSSHGASSEKRTRNLIESYGADGIIFVQLRGMKRKSLDDVCMVQMTIEADGYDARGNDLGVAVSKSLNIERNSCDEAARICSRQLGYTAGRLIAHKLAP